MSEPTWPNKSWTPKHQGNDIFCSPGCGGRCTWTAYKQAVKDADRLAKRLGGGWTPHVMENLGWHVHVSYGDPVALTVHFHFSKPDGKITGYSALLGGGIGQWQGSSGNCPTPEEAIKIVLEQLAAKQQELHQLAERVEGWEIPGTYPSSD